MNPQNVLVTTTQTLEGWEIEAYLGPVFSHIVAGTGLLGTWAASITDFVGGRSQSYQKQLSAINFEAIELLKYNASLMGGNLILGLKVDHDEVSGKAKQLFMVTASGTAAHGRQKISTKTDQYHRPFLTSEALDIALKKKEIIKNCQKIPISLTEEDWNFATENQFYEIAPQVLESLQRDLELQTPQMVGYFERRRKYFLSLPDTHAISALYGCLKNDSSLFSFVRDTVFQGCLFDFDALFALLASRQFKTQKWALGLASANKPFYTLEDISKFSKLKDLIKSTFVVRVKFIEEKSKLTSSVKQVWVCECGTKNYKDEANCTSCSRDLYGFSKDEPRIEKVLKSIESKEKILQELFH
jgi:uncharacterized protein YbjQ (UPF0145 family)